MTTCSAHAASVPHANDRRTGHTTLAPAGKPARAVRPTRLLRLLTGADSIRIPQHPRRRRSRRF